MKFKNKNKFCEKCICFSEKGYCNNLKIAVFKNNHCARFSSKTK